MRKPFRLLVGSSTNMFSSVLYKPSSCYNIWMPFEYITLNFLLCRAEKRRGKRSWKGVGLLEPESEMGSVVSTCSQWPETMEMY
ncbi:hypothetical protein M378DRAFT_541068 [Amanita muscaria Koide BX008]|uniref:Uncharacterized protein n=1 Tax=Amanita muscaria (strain Koide BX008) TaxID=946122 RepID=A0A0C2WIY5_AMAMK|nr:hypothetical protein M378DRAFT_541068 [Amanita muscaria Koide BX008]